MLRTVPPQRWGGLCRGACRGCHEQSGGCHVQIVRVLPGDQGWIRCLARTAASSWIRSSNAKRPPSLPTPRPTNSAARSCLNVDRKDWPAALVKRKAGNEVLKDANSEWFFPEAKKKRSSVPVGNTARMLMINPDVAPKLLTCFYPDATTAETDVVTRAVEGATNLRMMTPRMMPRLLRDD